MRIGYAVAGSVSRPLVPLITGSRGRKEEEIKEFATTEMTPFFVFLVGSRSGGGHPSNELMLDLRLNLQQGRGRKKRTAGGIQRIYGAWILRTCAATRCLLHLCSSLTLAGERNLSDDEDSCRCDDRCFSVKE